MNKVYCYCYWINCGKKGGREQERELGLCLLCCDVLLAWSKRNVPFWGKSSVCCDGERDSSAVRAPDSWLKGRGFESPQERRKNFLLQGQLSVLTLISVSVPRCVTTIARKRSRSFCQKCRWQVTAKRTYTLRMWLYMKWHGAWCTQNLRRDGSNFMWHQPCQHCKYTTSMDIQKRAIKS